MAYDKPDLAAPAIVDRAAFQAEVDALRVREKAHTKEGDAIAAARRRLPMVKVDGTVKLIGENGLVTLLDAFEGRRMLIAYYYMWFDGEPAPEQCEGCTFFTTQVRELSHIHSRDVTYATFCQGSHEESVRYRDFMGWEMPWYSVPEASLKTLLAGRRSGIMYLICYLRQGSDVFETYWTTRRGVEAMDNSYRLLDLTVYGRQEDFEDSPSGWPQYWGETNHPFRRDGRPISHWRRLEEADGDLPEEIDQRLGEIETALDERENRPVIYDPADIARAGVFISIDRDGALVVIRGYVRPEDEAPEVVERDGAEADDETGGDDGDDEPALRRTTITIGGRSSEPEEDEEGDAVKPLPERLVIEFTAHRTLALRNAVAGNPHVAMTALLHWLVLDTFGERSFPGCVEASVRKVQLSVQEADLNDSPSAKAVTEREQAWKSDIPFGDDEALWTWLDGLDDASRLALLAHRVSYGINALFERPNPHSGSGVSQHGLDQRLREADRLARATGLDMVGWRPTVANYLGRVTKARILEAVREGAGEQAAQLIDHLKKGDMAKEGERLLADSGWLSQPLRLIGMTRPPTSRPRRIRRCRNSSPAMMRAARPLPMTKPPMQSLPNNPIGGAASVAPPTPHLTTRRPAGPFSFHENHHVRPYRL